MGQHSLMPGHELFGRPGFDHVDQDLWIGRVNPIFYYVDKQKAHEKINQALSSGKAAEKFNEMLPPKEIQIKITYEKGEIPDIIS